MTHTLKDLLDPEQREALIESMNKSKPKHDRALLEAIVAPLLKPMTLEEFVDAVIDPLTLPEDVIPASIACPPEPVLGVDIVVINGVQVDLRGDARFVTSCADCSKLREVDVAPEGVDLSVERVVRCDECAKAYLKQCASEGKAVTVVRKPQVAKHQPRKKDGIDQPITTRHIAEKEQDMDLTQYSAPQLATLIERANDILRTKAEDALASNVKEAIAARAEEAVVDQALMEADRETRQGVVLAAFEVKGVEIPALDLSEVTDMSTVVPAKQRSPYNKALYRLGEPIIEPDKATYGEVAKVHERLGEVEVARKPAKAKAKSKGKKAAKAHKVTAVVESKAKAKFSKAQIAALAKVKGCTKDEARALLESV